MGNSSSRPSTPTSASASKSKSKSSSSKKRSASRERRMLHVIERRTHHEGAPKPSKIRLKYYDVNAIENANERAAFAMVVDFENQIRENPQFNPATHALWHFFTEEEKRRFKGLLDKEGKVIASKQEREVWRQGFERDWNQFWDGGSGRQSGPAGGEGDAAPGRDQS
ncbi:hypothetical protein TARUN_5852 [Trichoderma arundinaceum]|uniref:Uncharacterized protein n=1 Tax=Trichoderma arundinaceum TaxID=490622 RepID=A0A395NK40_TRIAR|nr:hypothetical protein TARUN_5852 [Trichoderma arundinaceum]